MSYDIPDKVRYKEKIVFGLDGKQLIYALLFGFVALLAYGLPITGQAKFMVPSFIALVGAGFVFLNLEEPVRKRLAYHSNIRFGGALDRKVQDFVGIKRIENDVVYLKNGEMRAIIGVVPISFQNLDEGRKKSVILNYRDFLNQLTHPIQILVRTVNVSLAEYFAHKDERIKHSKNRQLVALYEEFKLWEQTFVKKNQVKERLYYVVIPYNPNASVLAKQHTLLESLKDAVGNILGSGRKPFSELQDEFHRKELGDRVSIIREKLLNCGLVTRRLSSNELISLFMSYFDGYVEVNEDYLSRIVVAKSFFEKKGENHEGKSS